jgi:hypothetical protein
MSKDKLSLTYKDRKLTIKLGKKELPLNALIDPAEIVLSANNLPTLRFEMLVDNMTIDDIEAFGKYVTKEELYEPTKSFKKDS